LLRGMCLSPLTNWAGFLMRMSHVARVMALMILILDETMGVSLQ